MRGPGWGAGSVVFELFGCSLLALGHTLSKKEAPDELYRRAAIDSLDADRTDVIVGVVGGVASALRGWLVASLCVFHRRPLLKRQAVLIAFLAVVPAAVSRWLGFAYHRMNAPISRAVIGRI